MLTPDLLLKAYAAGLFPMAEHRDAEDIYWVEPKQRGVLPLDGLHISHSLAKIIRQERFVVTCDSMFQDVMRACAEPAPGREETWINTLILDAYTALHRQGHAHSIECWQEGRLVGGLYGVSLGAAFFGESMFSRVTDASKVALVHLVARLRFGGYRLLDTQFLTEHLARLGACEIGRSDYLRHLQPAVQSVADFYRLERDYCSSDGEGSAGAASGALDGFAGDSRGAGAPPRTVTVSGPLSGKRILQLLTQTP